MISQIADSAEPANPGSHPPGDARAHRGKVMSHALGERNESVDALQVGRSEENLGAGGGNRTYYVR